MAEDPTPTTETPTPEPEPETETVTPEQLKSMQVALKRANKEAETNRLKLKEFEDRDKTELEKATERVAAAERRANEVETTLVRHRVAARKGLPAELAERLRGDTEAEMETDADTLVGLLKTSTTKPPPAVPTGARTNGGGPDMNQLIRERMR